MLASLEIMINYGQLILYVPSVERPGHLWGETELDQGFAWSLGMVSLGVPEHAFMCRVEVGVTQAFEIHRDAISCVRMPFDVDDGAVCVGSVFGYDEVDVPPGPYSLFYEVLPGEGNWEIEGDGETETGPIDYRLRILLVPGISDGFEILKSGGAVHSDRVLSRLTSLA